MKHLLTILSVVSLLAGQIRIGVTGGVSASSVWGEKGDAVRIYAHDRYGYSAVDSTEPSMLTKPVWGISVEAEVASRSSIITGASLVQRGIRNEWDLGSVHPVFMMSDWIKQTWLEIPVLYNFNLYRFRHFSIDVQGGVWGSIRLNSEEYVSEMEDGSLKEIVLPEDERFFTDLSSFDLGIQVGVPLAFSVGERLEFSLTPSFSLGFIPQVSYDDFYAQVNPDPNDIYSFDTLYLSGGEKQFYDFRVVGGVSFLIGDSKR